MARSFIEWFDHTMIAGIRAFHVPIARLAIAMVFFWFGLLKVIGASPADALVREVLGVLAPLWDPAAFAVFLGIYEMAVGVAFLLPGFERVAIALLAPHMISTFLPFVLISHRLWVAPFIPTLEGQYIVKNVVIVALALGFAARLRPFHLNQRKGACG